MTASKLTDVLDARIKSVRSALGEPVVEIPGILLYNVNSLEAMPCLPSEIVDLAITSPPYNIGKEYETPMPLESYIQWTATWIREVYRLTSPTGAFWLNLGYLAVPERGRAIPIPYLLWEHIPFYLIQEVVWNYGAGVATKRMFSPRNEKFLWYVKSPEEYTFNLDAVRDPNVKYPNQKKNGKVRVNPLGKNPTDVWQVPKVTTGENMTGRRASPERTNHPAQFPVAVIERIIRACSKPGDIIFDPFLGSGTTAEVAMANGRLAIGFEISKEYIEIAAKRLSVSGLDHAQGKLL
jgi:adenine-specific DNA-methyltransferase